MTEGYIMPIEHFNPKDLEYQHHPHKAEAGISPLDLPGASKPESTKPYVVAFSGTHGTGKTTAVFNEAGVLKRLHQNKTVGVLLEQAAMSPYPINQNATLQSQLWIFSTQLSMELELLSKFDIVVADRTVVDNIAYSKVLGFSSVVDGMLKIVREHMGVYQRIYFKYAKDSLMLVDDGIRDSTDRKFQKDVEDALLGLYSELGFSF